MQESDFKWFTKHYDEFCNQYGNAFLAIKDEHVLNAYSSYGEAVRETQKSEILGTFIVQECKKNGEKVYCCLASMNFA